MLLGILVSVANLTASTWNYEPTEQTIETLDANTAVTFANPSGENWRKRRLRGGETVRHHQSETAFHR